MADDIYHAQADGDRWYKDIFLAERFLGGEELGPYDKAAVKYLLSYLLACEGAERAGDAGNTDRMGWREDRSEARQKWRKVRSVKSETSDPLLSEEELRHLDDPPF